MISIVARIITRVGSVIMRNRAVLHILATALAVVGITIIARIATHASATTRRNGIRGFGTCAALCARAVASTCVVVDARTVYLAIICIAVETACAARTRRRTARWIRTRIAILPCTVLTRAWG